MIKKLNTKDIKTAEHIIDLQKKSYNVEAKLIDFYDIPPLKDTVNNIITCEETFYGYYQDNLLMGLISYKLEGDWLDIYRVAVHPEHFRKGIAGQMIDFIEDIDSGIRKITVSTGLKNLPAINLYLNCGFKKTHEIEVMKGVNIVSFEKILKI